MNVGLIGKPGEGFMDWDKMPAKERVKAAMFLKDKKPEKIQLLKPKFGWKRKDPKIGRNSLCPCGSGKKFKKCCLDGSPKKILVEKRGV